MFGSLQNVTLSRTRICLESLLEHFIFLNFPPNPPQGKVANHITPYNFEPPILQILYAPMLWPLCNCITVYRYQFDKSMLICAIIIIKDHKMKQIINDLPKINPELYLSSSIIKNVTPRLQRFFYLMLSFCLTIRGHILPNDQLMIPINDNWVLNNHDHKISLHCSNHHLKLHNIGQASWDVKYLLS